MEQELKRNEEAGLLIVPLPPNSRFAYGINHYGSSYYKHKNIWAPFRGISSQETGVTYVIIKKMRPESVESLELTWQQET